MSLTRNKSVFYSIMGGALGRSVTLLAPFIVMPIILREIDEYLFGIWMTAISITSMALFLDFGIGNGLLTKLSYHNGLKQYGEMKEYIISAYVALIILAILLLLLSISIYFYYYNTTILSNENKLAVNIILVSLFTFIIGIPVSIIQRVMYATHHILQSNIWQIIGSVVGVATCYIAVVNKLTPALIILSYSLPPILVTLLSTFIFFHKNRKIAPKVKHLSKQKSYDLLGIGSKFLLLSILTSIALNVDNFIISLKIGPEFVTNYSIPAKLASLLGVVITTLFLPLWTANGDAIAKKDYSWIMKTTKKMMLYGTTSIILLSLILITFNKQIIYLWMGRSFYNQDLTLIFLCSLSVFMAIGSPWYMILNSLGKIELQIKVWTLFLVVTIILKLLFLSQEKLWVIALISSVSYMIIILPLLSYTSYKLIRDLKAS